MAQRKNILLISIDDGGAYWRFRDAFRERLQTPNLDRICDVSAAFTSAYCQAPICGPSRNSMLTGLAPHQIGILDNYTNLFSVMRAEQLWQFRLKRAGYYCSTAGKVHHGFAPLPSDIHNTLYSHPPKALKLGPPRNVPMTRYGGLTGGAATTKLAHEPMYYDHQSASDAVEFLKNYDRAQPFYREVGFHHPHIPYRTPARFKELYDEENFKQPEAWAYGFDVAGYPDLFMPENIDLRDIGHWRKSVRNYFSAYSHVDSQIGRVWDALQASGHAKDTIVLLFSDHGYHLGDKNRMRKFTLWEESCRVPLIVHDPDALPREVSDPVALLDVGPTILDYAECRSQSNVPGRSLVPQINGASDPDRAVPTFLFGNASMRQGSYRITRYENGESEFYDVEDDPWLTKNLAGAHPFFEAMMAELRTVSAAHGLALGGTETTAGPSSNSQPAAPGYRVCYATPRDSRMAAIPDGFTKMHYAADAGGDIDSFVAVGNREDNELVFPGNSNRFQLDVHPGPGRNLVIAQNDDLVVYCDSGDTEIRAGNSPSVLFGGSGRDVMHTGIGPTCIEGGAGPVSIQAGAGPTDIVSGSGNNRVITGTGPTRIELNGGSNEVEVHSELLHLTIKRTGLPQRIGGFRSGTIDLSDWSPLGHGKLDQRDGDSILSCISETVIFCDTNAEQLRPNIVGLKLG